MRDDKGNTVFNSDSRRKQVFTALNEYKKECLRQYHESPDRLDEKDLKSKFDLLPEDVRVAYEQRAQQNLLRGPYLHQELCDILLSTKGKLSYESMAMKLGDIVSQNTVRLHIQSLDGFCHRKSRLLPHLSEACRKKRVIHCETFWVFWESAKVVSAQIRYIYAMKDEKWFFVVVTRTKNKVVTSIGLEEVDHFVQHRSHVGKEMYVVMFGYLLTNNDITAGGKAIPIACIRVGHYEEAKKDTYKRVYHDDGTYTMPKIAENQLQRKGELYWKALELTGSSDGTEKKPKCSLLRLYREKILPKMDEVARKYSENGLYKVVMVKQEDNAGPYHDKTYVPEMQSEFDCRDWLLVNQPPSSPVLNVNDCATFPCMSKRVTREQVMCYGSQLVAGEELHRIVTKVFNDEALLPTVARAFAGHHQIVCLVLDHNGDNNYLS